MQQDRTEAYTRAWCKSMLKNADQPGMAGEPGKHNSPSPASVTVRGRSSALTASPREVARPNGMPNLLSTPTSLPRLVCRTLWCRILTGEGSCLIRDVQAAQVNRHSLVSSARPNDQP